MLRDHLEEPTAIRTQFGAIFVSLELSQKTWLITSLSPGKGEKMSKHGVEARDVAGLLARFAELQRKAAARTGKTFPIIVIQEAGMDGFSIHRVLRQQAIESHVVDPASIAAPRRRRRAKTDRLDGEALLRALLAFKRGEPRVCSMVVAPSVEEEDQRRLCRERDVLIGERISHVNRIKGLLSAQGIADYLPLARDRRKRLLELRTLDGRPLPAHMKAQISRELDRLELVVEQIKAVEKERNRLLLAASPEAGGPAVAAAGSKGPALLAELRGLAADSTTKLWSEGLSRSFANRRQVAAYAGLAPTPWRSGSLVHEQGVSKAGNPRLRTTMVQIAWLWLQHQPQSALARWYFAKVGERPTKARKKATIVALARKLLVALWKYATFGEAIAGAAMKRAA
ncbi:MAG TPA: IS110 family transposase [Roseiarcus sp.]|nr:IS110 family transposase [Roseiarcus sp.]